MASEIVVGIDFGTTYSGVSWAVNAGKKEVQLVDDWPHPSDPNSHQKLPTAVSYNGSDVANWGYTVKPNEQVFKWFKILLDPENKYRKTAQPTSTEQMLRTQGKTAEQVAADYLRQLWEYTKKDIARLKGAQWETSYEVIVVLTVPAIWSDQAKGRTRKAAVAAGLPGNISLVSEPEAAAHAVIADKKAENDLLEVGDCFVVCDCGGGTVDLISYKVTNLSPFQVEECAVGDGGLCGSVFIDLALEKRLKTLIGEGAYYAIKDKFRARMWEEFEGVKRSYEGDPKKEFSVDLKGVEDNPDEGIEDDTIILRPALMKTLFDYVVNQIIHLVEKQIDEVQENGGKAKAVLLVGGFGSSKYIFKRLENAHRGDGITVLQVQRAWSAICRGATLWGLENSENAGDPPPYRTVAARIARFSYGVCVAEPFDPLRHSIQDRMLHPDNNWYANNQMQWLIQKGQRLEIETGVTYSIVSAVGNVRMWTGGCRDFTQQLWCCGDSEPPSRKGPNVKPFCAVNFSVDCTKLWLERSYRSKQTGEKWRDAVFILVIGLDSTSLHFGVIYQGEPVAYTEAKYMENF